MIIGGSGQVGESLTRLCQVRGWPAVATYCSNPRPEAVFLDAADASAVQRLIRQLEPWMAINCSNARGGTDACEVDPTLAQRVHFGSARNLVDAARDVHAKFLQMSTDYVFDGREGPYAETTVPQPLSKLGWAKLHAEQYALAQIPQALVVRSSFIFSWSPRVSAKNFVMQLLECDRTGTTMRVPTDQVGNVTYAPNLAEALMELIEQGASGLVHVAGTTRCSKYAWARRVIDVFGLRPTLIQGVSTDELTQAGPRPLQSGFRLEKVVGMLKRTQLMSLEEGLSAMKAEMSLAGVSA